MRSAAFATLLLACGGQPSEDVLTEADLSPSRWHVVGRLAEPDLLVPYIAWPGSPQPLAVELDADAGIPLLLTVKPQTGDPVAFVATPAGQVVAAFHDRLIFRPRVAGRYLIVFRERLGRKTVFAVGAAGLGRSSRVKMRWQWVASDQAALDRHAVDAAALPPAARDRFAQQQARFGKARAWAIDGFFAVGCGQEERFWVDLYDTRGVRLAHGYDGDSGPMIATWRPSPYDPSG